MSRQEKHQALCESRRVHRNWYSSRQCGCAFRCRCPGLRLMGYTVLDEHSLESRCRFKQTVSIPGSNNLILHAMRHLNRRKLKEYSSRTNATCLSAVTRHAETFDVRIVRCVTVRISCSTLYRELRENAHISTEKVKISALQMLEKHNSSPKGVQFCAARVEYQNAPPSSRSNVAAPRFLSQQPCQVCTVNKKFCYGKVYVYMQIDGITLTPL